MDEDGKKNHHLPSMDLPPAKETETIATREHKSEESGESESSNEGEAESDNETKKEQDEEESKVQELAKNLRIDKPLIKKDVKVSDDEDDEDSSGDDGENEDVIDLRSFLKERPALSTGNGEHEEDPNLDLVLAIRTCVSVQEGMRKLISCLVNSNFFSLTLFGNKTKK
jgi:hypothetical protein